MKPSWLIVGLIGMAGLPLVAGAAGRCTAGIGGCSTDSASLRLRVPADESATGAGPSSKIYDRVPHIAPINTQPEGQTYGRWAAAWWQWALGVPAAVNPVSDISGANCAQRQVDEVWFLAGSFSSNPTVRTCNIPAGKSLFFPLINNVYVAFLNDPPETRTEDYVRAHASCTEPVKISASIDGLTVFNPTQFFTGPSGSQSPFFNAQMPPGNVFGADETVVPELVLSPSAEQGYYLFVRPLPPGSHTIHWIASGCTAGNIQDITYHLKIVDGHSHQ